MTHVYEIEIIGPKGNRFVKGYFNSIIDARKRAMKEIGSDKNLDAIIHKREGYGIVSQAEHIYSDDKDFILQQYTTHRRYRASPRTGRLLDYDRYWKYV